MVLGGDIEVFRDGLREVLDAQHEQREDGHRHPRGRRDPEGGGRRGGGNRVPVSPGPSSWVICYNYYVSGLFGPSEIPTPINNNEDAWWSTGLAGCRTQAILLGKGNWTLSPYQIGKRPNR